MKELNKVFLIGFNKTATTSISKVFEQHIGPTIHHTDWWGYSNLTERYMKGETSNETHHKRSVDESVAINHFKDHKCFTDGYEGWYGTDLESQEFPDLKFLDKNFPNSKFILNTRSLDKWLLSRLYNFHNVTVYPVTKIDTNDYDSVATILSHWTNVREHWHKHVINYFKGRDDFKVVDIDGDWVSELNSFLDINATSVTDNKTSFNTNKVKFKDMIDKFIKENE